MASATIRYKHFKLGMNEVPMVMVSFKLDGCQVGDFVMARETWAWFHLALISGLKNARADIDLGKSE